MAGSDLTAQRLRDFLDYDPVTGVFTRRRPSGTAHAGDVAGGVAGNGYVLIGVDGKRHYGHRLAWLYMTRAWPAAHIDHINGDPSDNRFANLRDVDRSTNLQNMRNAMRVSKSGILGAYWAPRDRRWTAQIRIKGKRTSLGYFDTAEEAGLRYLEAKRLHHAGCTI